MKAFELLVLILAGFSLRDPVMLLEPAELEQAPALSPTVQQSPLARPELRQDLQFLLHR